ncbi:MAG: transposase [Methylocapsa sp.]|nr:transposase [Methylocapsa sp.]
MPEAAWQRCGVRFLRNAIDHLPRKRGGDCLKEPGWLSRAAPSRRRVPVSRRGSSAGRAAAPSWRRAGENIDEALTYFSPPQAATGTGSRRTCCGGPTRR